MKIITQLVILTLSLLLVDANSNQYCNNLINLFKNNCTMSAVTINNCCDLKPFPVSGIFNLRKGSFDNSVHAYCDMVTNGGGWIVIQRNKKGSLVNFNKNWTDYEEGFGDLKAEFWYGLEKLHCLTQRGHWEMRLDYQLNNKTWFYAHYNQFSVGSANEEYPLTVGGFTGVANDLFIPKAQTDVINEMKFTTPDNDNDKDRGNCGILYGNGWWYNRCAYVNINRQPPYYYYPHTARFTEMKIRPKGCII